MSSLNFAWDLSKAAVNVKKHGVPFNEAITVFNDEYGREFYDPTHSQLEEDRFLFLGISSTMRLLLVCYCYRENDTLLRIISARKATKKEAEFYDGGYDEKRV